MSLVNPQLEEAILAAPNDPARYAVYGDWLLANGDPRGELVAIQAALATQKDPAKFLELKKTEAAALARILPDAVPLSPAAARAVKVSWRWGFAHHVRIDLRERLHGEDLPDPATVLGEVLRLPALRFVQGVSVCALNELPAAVELLAKLNPPVLRRVELRGPVNQPGGVQTLASLQAAFPKLEHLTLEGGQVDRLDFPALRTLELFHLMPTAPLSETLRAAAWPQLRKLTLSLELPAEDLKPALSLPHLTEIGIGAEDMRPLIALVAARPNLSQLVELDLLGPTYDDGLGPLVARRAALRKLKLDVHRGELEGKLVKQLRASVKALVLGDVQVWEQEDAGVLVMGPEDAAAWRERERQLAERAERETEE